MLVTLVLFISFQFIISAQNVEVTRQLDSLLNYLAVNNGFSGAVTLRQNEKLIYSGNFNKLSNGTHIYRIGSVSKVYTAIIVYQLIEEGKLSLSTSLDLFFPEIKYADQITIEQMLSHSSGIYNVTDNKSYYGTRQNHFGRQDIIRLITRHKPVFKPGKDCSYSNSNFILLGFIIEEFTRKNYAQNVQERISSKFNLTKTWCEDKNSDKDLRESSFKFDGETWQKDVDSDPGLPFSAGAMISTPEEMSMMVSLLFNQQRFLTVH